jgi:hypothetical protein
VAMVETESGKITSGGTLPSNFLNKLNARVPLSINPMMYVPQANNECVREVMFVSS